MEEKCWYVEIEVVWYGVVMIMIMISTQITSVTYIRIYMY